MLFTTAEIVLFKVGFASSFSAKLADTFGSEIGKRFGKDTYLITSLKKVERGTEGGISIEGTHGADIAEPSTEEAADPILRDFKKFT